MNAPESQPDPMSNGLRAAFPPAGAPESTLLRQLDLKGVHLPDADEHDVPVKIDEAIKALRDPSGRYQVLGEIGRGGVGIVYKGRDVNLGRDVAMKVLRQEHASHPEILARFVEEAQIGGQLQHPGIVPVYDLGLQHGERPYFAMKLIKGETLAALLGKRSDLVEDRRRYLGIFEQICQTIAYAHARRVVHRDLKPANVMIGAFGEVQVVDWGFAKILPKGGVADEANAQDKQRSAVSVIATVRNQPGSGSKSVQGSMLGTPAYMPPEQAQGDVEHVDRRSDVFALGAILCEILTGMPPYVSQDPLRQAAKGDLQACFERLDQSSADAPLLELCKECLSLARQTRPSSAQEVAARISGYLSSVEERARQAQIHAAEAKVRARATMLLSAAAVLLLALGGGGYLWIEQQAVSRRQVAEQRVAQAMNEANAALGAAQAGDDQGLWQHAVAAARQAASLADNADVGRELQSRAGDLLVVAESEHGKAQAASARHAKDSAMHHALLEARIPVDEDIRTSTEQNLRRQDAAYAAAFASYLDGADPTAMPVDTAVTALVAGTQPVELAAALDHWSLGRDALGDSTDPPDPSVTASLRAIAARLDAGDSWRNRLRQLLPRASAERAELEKLAADADPGALPAVSLVLLGEALWHAGAREQAVALYRRGQEVHGSDFGLCFHLALMLELLEPPRRAEAVEYYRIARALLPALKEVRHRLGMALSHVGDHAAALSVFSELVRADEANAHWRAHAGAEYGYLGRLDESIASCGRAIDLDPTDHFAHGKLGDTLRDQGKLDEAIVSYRRAIESYPNYAAAHAGLGRALEAQGKLDEAIVSYRRAIEIEPNYADAHAALGRALRAQGKLDEAIASYRRAIEVDPKNAAAHSNLGSALKDKGKLDEAIASYRRAIEVDPKYGFAHNSLGNALIDKGEVDEAIMSYRRAIEVDPKYAVAYSNLGSALAVRGMLDEAIVNYRRAIEIDPKYAAAHSDLGSALKEQGKLDEAIASCRRAIEIDPKDAAAHNNLGSALADRGMLDEAIVSYRRAIEIDPKDAVAYRNLGVMLKAQGKVDEAIVSCRRAIDLDPKNSELHSNLGLALEEKGELVEAIVSYRRAIELDPKDGFAHANLGDALWAQGKLDEAIASYRQAIELEPKNAATHGNLGGALLRLKRNDEAVESFRRAIELDPGRADYHRRLGDALGSRRRDEATASYRRALELDPEHGPAWFNLGLRLQELGRDDEAVAAYRRAAAVWESRQDAFSVEWRAKARKRIAELEPEVGKMADRLALARGERTQATDVDFVAAADLVYRRGEHVLSAHTYARAFVAFPALLETARHRYNAACAAALAGCGKGDGALDLTDAERAALRDQARAWFAAEVESLRREVVAGGEGVGEATRRLQHSVEDPDFDGVRGELALAKLPTAEAESWRGLWKQVAELLAPKEQGK